MIKSKVHLIYAALVISRQHFLDKTGRRAQLVTCLFRDKCLTADPGVLSLILAQSHTFVEIDHEIISRTIILPSPDTRRVGVSYKRKYVHEVLVNPLVKLVQEKSVVRWTVCPDMTIAVD